MGRVVRECTVGTVVSWASAKRDADGGSCLRKGKKNGGIQL